MSSAYYYLQSGRPIGPVSAQQLKALADASKLLPTDLIWKQGTSGQRETAPAPTPKTTRELPPKDHSPPKGAGGSPVVPPRDQLSIAQLIAAAKELKPEAIEQLAAAGPKAIPAIIEALRRDDSKYSWATAAMAKMGPGAVEPVVGLLSDADSFMRKIAYKTLGEMGPMAMPAVPFLRQAARREGDPRNRGLPQNALSQITRR
jgi:hypothetical protein